MDRQKLKGAYIAKGLTLATLAKKIDMSEPTLRLRLNNGTLTQIDIEKITNVLELDEMAEDEIFYDAKFRKVMTNKDK